jgi:predicted nucleotidyltransferase
MDPASSQVTITNRCATRHVNPAFWPVITATIAGSLQLAGSRVGEIRLQGSISRGDARVGHADLDMVVLMDASEAEADAPWMELVMQLSQAFPVVTRIDLDARPRTDLGAFQQFILASDSLNVYGQDRLTQAHQTMDRRALARLVTPNPAEMVADYQAWGEELTATSSADEVRFASRIIGKDLLKVLRGLALLRGAPYEVTIPQIASQITAWAPEFAPVAEQLLACYVAPSTDPQHVRHALAMVHTTGMVDVVTEALA